MKKHRKHADLKRRSLGNYGYFEISILGSKCSTIKKLVDDISVPVSEKFSIAYADASHEDNLHPPLIDSYTFHNSGNLLSMQIIRRTPTLINWCSLNMTSFLLMAIITQAKSKSSYSILPKNLLSKKGWIK